MQGALISFVCFICVNQVFAQDLGDSREYRLDDSLGKIALYPGQGYRSYVREDEMVSSLDELERRVGLLPKGTRLYWKPFSLDRSRQPILFSEGQSAAFEKFCGSHEIELIVDSSLAKQENQPKNIVVNPERIEGPWECPAQDGIHGFFIKVEGGQYAQSSSIRIYHRQNSKEHWGYFDSGESTTGSVTLDDMHFTMQFTGQTDVGPFKLDLRFDPAAQRWTGTWSACSKTGEAVLTRPHLGVAKESPIVGDWKGKPNPNGRPWFTAGSLHFRQSSDGLLIAWMDRAFDDGRNGEQLRIVSAGPSVVELQTTFGVGANYTYTGTVSPDGKYLSGVWHVGNIPGMSLQAPDYFEREQASN